MDALNDDVHRALGRFIQREYGGWRGRVQKDANSKKSKTRERSQQIAALFPALNAALSNLNNKKDIKLPMHPMNWLQLGQKRHAANSNNWRRPLSNWRSLVEQMPQNAICLLWGLCSLLRLGRTPLKPTARNWRFSAKSGNGNHSKIPVDHYKFF